MWTSRWSLSFWPALTYFCHCGTHLNNGLRPPSAYAVVVRLRTTAAFLVTIIVRPPDTFVGGLGFYRDSSIFYLLSLFFFFFFSLAEGNSTKTGLGSKCGLKTHVQNVGYPLPHKTGARNHHFRRLRNLTATLTAYIFGTKYNIGYIIGQVRCKLQRTSSQKDEFWPTNDLKSDLYFYPASVNSAFYFIARLHRRRSANGTQPNFGKRWTVNRANNLP